MSNAIAVAGGGLSLPENQQLPAFMAREQGARGEGKEGLKQYFVPPRLKIVQSQARKELRDRFPIGTIVAMPAGVVVANSYQSFLFTPFFQFTEFVTFNPIAEGVDTIRDRSTDPSSEIAKKARNTKTRREACPDQILKDPSKNIMRHTEVINYLSVIWNVPELHMMPVLIPFMSGGFKDGKMVSTLIEFRANDPDIYACVLQGVLSDRKGDGNDYFGINIENPRDGGWYVQSNEEYLALQAMHRKFKLMYGGGELRADYDTEAVAPGAGQVFEAESRQLPPDGLDPSHDSEF